MGALLLGVAGVYVAGVVAVRRRGRYWPGWRTLAWCAGVATAAAALTGPVAAGAHHDFGAHMLGHLLLGMAAPLLLVLGAPITLALRALPVRAARTVSRFFANRLVRGLTHPVTAATLDAGGLWLLYTTGLYAAMGAHPWLHLVVHAHILFAGYLFTASVVGEDPAPHRPGRPVRAGVLVAFLAAHAVLAKHVYAHPPAGVPAAAAEPAAQLMYYGGDVIHLALIAIFCAQWYRATAPARTPTGPRIAATHPPGRPWRLPDDLRTAGHDDLRTAGHDEPHVAALDEPRIAAHDEPCTAEYDEPHVAGHDDLRTAGQPAR